VFSAVPPANAGAVCLSSWDDRENSTTAFRRPVKVVWCSRHLCKSLVREWWSTENPRTRVSKGVVRIGAQVAFVFAVVFGVSSRGRNSFHALDRRYVGVMGYLAQCSCGGGKVLVSTSPDMKVSSDVSEGAGWLRCRRRVSWKILPLTPSKFAWFQAKMTSMCWLWGSCNRVTFHPGRSSRSGNRESRWEGMVVW